MDDLSVLPLRELIALARQRLGPAASRLKTRAEFVAAMSAPSGSPESPVAATPAPPRPPVVTRDFFVARRA